VSELFRVELLTAFVNSDTYSSAVQVRFFFVFFCVFN